MTRPRRQQVASTVSVPAPVGGLNARDAIANMAQTDAVIMDNFFPETASVSLRKGYQNWATGLPGQVETLMAYNSATSRQLFAICGGNVYDVTAQGAVGAPVLTGLSNSRFQFANIGTPGGQFLIAVNGVDNPLLYNGVNWQQISNSSTPIAITGVNPANFIHVALYQNRLWFIEKNSLRVWFLPIQAIGGAASSFDLSTLFRLGGYLMAMPTWTLDNAFGINEYILFLTSEGEVAMYQGTDPTNSASWGLKGKFRTGRPIGRRCFAQVGSDVVVITADGVFPMSKALLTDRSQNQDAITDKIINAVSNAVQSYGSNYGWQPILYPIGNKFIVNVPIVESAQQIQYVMNTITGAWCRFTGWNASCWEVMGDNLYFGGATVVCQADTGMADNGVNILGDVKPAFSYFNAPGRLKRFTMVRPIIASNGKVNAVLDLNIDYEDRIPQATPTFSVVAGSPWNTSRWNISPWAGGTIMNKDWQGVTGLGYAASVRMQVAGNGVSMNWQSTDWVMEPGGTL